MEQHATCTGADQITQSRSLKITSKNMNVREQKSQDAFFINFWTSTVGRVLYLIQPSISTVERATDFQGVKRDISYQAWSLIGNKYWMLQLKGREQPADWRARSLNSNNSQKKKQPKNGKEEWASPISVWLQEDVVSLLPCARCSRHNQAGRRRAHHGNRLGGVLGGVRLWHLWEDRYCRRET